MQITSHESDDGVTVTVAGELDLVGVDRLRYALRQAEREDKATVLDLRELRFVDAAGLGPILEADRRAREKGRAFAILPGPWAVHKVFCLTGLDGDLEFVSVDSDQRRADIAEDMRDGVLQSLFAAQVHAGNVLVSIETGDHTEARELAKAVVQAISGAITELRAVVTGLS